jgi:DNA-binding NarL/FixJ family response regulator
MVMMIRVLLVNQALLTGTLIAAVLEDEPDMEVVGCATSMEEALALASTSDVILANTRMANGAALQLIRAIVDAGLPTKVVVLGLAETKEEVLHYVQAGAAGYVLKDDSVNDLVERIRCEGHPGGATGAPEPAGAPGDLGLRP